MRRTCALLCSSLWLVCCDKPSPRDDDKDAVAPSKRVAASGHAPRPQAPDTPAAFRTILEAALKIESPAARERALADLAWNAVETDPKLACEAFLQLPAESTEKIRLIQHYAMRLAEQSPDEALAWAATVGSEREVSAAIAKIALVLADTDPRRAANLLSETGVASREFDVEVVQVLQRWAAQSPPDAAAWTIMFPPGAAREAGIQVISEQWLRRDAQTAFMWLETLQDDGLRKETLRAMEGVILQQPQEIQNEWLKHADAKIQSELEQQREHAIKDVGDNLPSLPK